jgi:hypothetical protein
VEPSELCGGSERFLINIPGPVERCVDQASLPSPVSIHAASKPELLLMSFATESHQLGDSPYADMKIHTLCHLSCSSLWAASDPDPIALASYLTKVPEGSVWNLLTTPYISVNIEP